MNKKAGNIAQNHCVEGILDNCSNNQQPSANEIAVLTIYPYNDD